MMARATPRCHTRKCIHLQGIRQDDMDERTERPYCSAFPNGIPDEISYGENLHTSHFSGQVRGFLYTKRSDQKEGDK